MISLFHYFNRPRRRFLISKNPVSYSVRTTRFNENRRFFERIHHTGYGFVTSLKGALLN